VAIQAGDFLAINTKKLPPFTPQTDFHGRIVRSNTLLSKTNPPTITDSVIRICWYLYVA
jgi:hypothetical protein